LALTFFTTNIFPRLGTFDSFVLALRFPLSFQRHAQQLPPKTDCRHLSPLIHRKHGGYSQVDFALEGSFMMKIFKIFLCGFALIAISASHAAFAASAPSVFKHITIDGNFADWAGVPPAFEDPADSTGSADYNAIYVANDEDFLYIRFTLHAPHEQFTSHENIFLDADNDPATGFSLFVGSEMLIQGGDGYQERDGQFNEGGINGLDWAAAPSGTASDFEMRISRKATYASDSTPVFAGDTIAFILESEDTNFARQDIAPDSEGVEYTFTTPPPPLNGSVDLVTMGSSTWRYLTPSTDPDPNWKNPGFDDSTWASGKGPFGYPQGGPRAVQTPLPTESPVVYLRTSFQWDKNTTGIVLAVSTLLSDGAVFYLNGQEVRRIRMPDGPIDFHTPANGGSLANQPEIFGIPPGALVAGENVLAVEVHDRIQNAMDLFFDLGLKASSDYPVVITDALQPADRSVVAGQGTTFSLEILGTPPLTYQWLKGGQPIEGATNATLEIPQVLAADAGAYSVRVTNPGGTVTSREAQLTVTGVPVAISDATLPADVTTNEGLPVTFTVQATGSAPVTYQWFKGSNPIDGATSATYTISNVAASDAGDYSVKVSNPVNSVTSRVAKLIVNSDITPPSIVSVSGTPNKVIVQFSEPVDTTTAGNIANYQLGGGLVVQSASPDAADPTRVTLTTSSQALGTQYTLTVTGVKDLFGNVIAAGASKSFPSTIIIDGSFDDWAGRDSAFTDDEEDPAAGTDFKDIWVSSDPDYIYIRFNLYNTGNPSSFLNNIFIDADNDTATGFPTYGIGSEMVIQSGVGYQEKNGAFNEGTINGLDFAISPEGDGNDFELRISRHAKYASDNTDVFTSDTIKFLLETENPSFSTTDTAPNSGGLEITLAQGALGSFQIARQQDGKVVISWTGPGKLQTRDSLTTGTWTDVPDATSPYTVTPTGQAFYRLTSE
jgi:hypothetical protein